MHDTMTYIIAQRPNVGNEDILNAFSSRHSINFGKTQFVIAFVLVFGFILFMVYLNKKQKKKESLEESMSRYNLLSVKLKFTEEEKAFIDMISVKFGLEAKGVFIIDRSIFNTLIERYINEDMVRMSDLAKSSFYTTISNLRRKLNFHKPDPHSIIRTTKEIDINQKISLHVGQRIYQSQVLENIEEYLIVTPPKYNDKHIIVSTGQDIYFYFYRSKDGHYRIKTKVIKLIPEPMYSLGLEHTKKIKLPVKRQYLRAIVSMETTFTVLGSDFFHSSQPNPATVFKNKHGTIVNISGGGAAVITSEDIDIGSYVILDFKLSIRVISNLQAKLLKKVRLNDTTFKYGMKFIGMHEDIKKFILDYCNHFNRGTGKRNISFR
ncbi:flagellar brake protein [Spirochaetota bacterium]